MLENKVLNDINRFEQRRILKVLFQTLVGIGAATLLFFPLFALAEYFLYLAPSVKWILVGGYFAGVFLLIGYFIVLPWWKLRNTRSLQDFEQLSRRISGQVLSVDDKLINYLQLLALSLSQQGNRLIALSLGQKQEVIQQLDLPGKMEVRIPPYFWKRALPVALLGFLLLAGFFDRVKEGSNRLIHVNQRYSPPAPFDILVSSFPSKIIAGQTLELKVKTRGQVVPAQMYIQLGNRTIRMENSGSGSFAQKVDGLEPGTYSIQLYSGQVRSEDFDLEVLPSGHIRNMRIRVEPPSYTGKKSSLLENEGNLEVLKGTRISWELESEHLPEIRFRFGKGDLLPFEKSSSELFRLSWKAMESGPYEITGQNELRQEDQKFSYLVSVSEDEFPRIQVQAFQDSISLSRQYFAGRISDDYGFSRLRAVLLDPSSKKPLAESAVPVRSAEKNQTFVFIPEGKFASVAREKASLLVFRVWDNDAVSGPKMSASQIFDVKEASKDAIAANTDRLDERNEEKMEELAKKTQSLEKNTRKMLDNLKGKKELNWQDKKELENYVEKQKDLFKQIEELKKEAEKALKNKEENQLQSQELLEKQEQINQMLEELLDEKTKEMLKELEKLLQQNQNKDQMQDAFEKMQDKNEFIQNELDRAMEMLKQLKVEEKLDKAIKDLDKLAEKQEQAGNENEKNGDKQSPEQKQEAQQKQEELNSMFKQVQEDLKEMEKLNQELKDKNNIDQGKEDQKEVEKDQKESGEQMQQGKMSKAGGSQKKAAQKMKKMAQKMKQSQMDMQGGADQEDIGDLRAIIENLLHLSFDQEDVYKQVSRVNQLDPKYLALTQKQIKIQDDSEIIKDSLKALAMRAPQIQSFVMKELYSMDQSIEEAVEYVKARRPDLASAKGQMAMTNINNLTVMLKDALQQMQQQQQQQSNSKGGKSCKKPGQGKPKPGSMSQMQKQINEQISQLKNGQKPGGQMSKELAQLAQKQAAMRRALSELEKSMQKGKEKSGGLGDVKALMEKTERDLLNKKLSPETVMRQQQILTRLLESEKALMEREQDQRREAEKPKSAERSTLPAELKELLQKSRSQNEQLLQGAPKLTEMYQDAFDKYLETLQERGL